MRYFIIIIYVLYILTGGGNMISAQAPSCTQNRYQTEIFGTQFIQDLTYAIDVPALLPPYTAEGLTFDEDLQVDVRLPQLYDSNGQPDTLTKRPLIIFAHSGGFALGGKGNDDMQAFIDTFAQRGYVTASMEYRLGIDPAFDTNSPERAVWRATQDMSTVIRFFKENSTLFQIDPNFVFLCGSSAGAFAAFHEAYMDNDERPSSTYSSFLMPDLGNKDIFPVVKYTALNPPANAGTVAAAHNSAPKAVASCWGAIGDTAWIENANIPMIFFHGDQDGIVPIEVGEPFNITWFPEVYGSIPSHTRLQNQGIATDLNVYAGEDHITYDEGINNGNWGSDGPSNLENWLEIVAKISDFFYARMQPTAPIFVGNTAPNAAEAEIYTISNPTAGTQYCWAAEGGTIVAMHPQGWWVQILWENTGAGSVSARTISEQQAESNWTTIAVWIDCAITLSISTLYADNDTILQQSQNSVVANNIVLNGAIVEYKAGEKIDLIASFRADAGADFWAHIAACQITPAAQVVADNTPQLLPLEPTAKTTAPATSISPALWSLAPNPASDVLYISGSCRSNERLHITLTDLYGRTLEQIYNAAATAGENMLLPLQIAHLPAGWYQIHITEENSTAAPVYLNWVKM